MTKILLLLLTALMFIQAGCHDDEKSSSETSKNTSEEPPQNPTDKNDLILNQLRELYPDLRENDVCIERPILFKDLALVGLFAQDRGCSGTDAFYKNEKTSLEKASSKVLLDNGWNDRNKRSQLAIDYTTDVLLAWKHVLREASVIFNRQEEHSFSLPRAFMEDGEVTVTCWVQNSLGVVPITNFYHFKAVYGNDGSVIDTEVSNRFSVED